MSMSAKSKNLGKRKRVGRSRSTQAKPRAGQFDPMIVARTQQIVPRYRVVVGYSAQDACYVGEGVELPNAIGVGDTEAECLKEVRGNMTAIVSTMLERGETPPLCDEPVRNVQVNVRFAPYEKASAEALATAAGQTLSDYIRAAALGR